MIRIFCILASFLGASLAIAQPAYVPDGTIVFGELHTPFGRIVERMVGHPYTHAAIVIDGILYEAGLPRVSAKRYWTQGKPGGVYDYYAPRVPWSEQESQRAKQYLRSQLGRAYGLQTWLNPRRQSQPGIYCSELVHGALNASGLYALPRSSGYDPPALLRSVHRDYRYFQTQRK